MSFLDRNASFAEELERLGQPSADQISRALAASEAAGRTLEDTLLELGIMPDDVLADTLAEWLRCPRFKPEADLAPTLDPNWGMDISFLRINQVCPATSTGGENFLLMADPRNSDLAEMVAYATGLNFAKCVATVGEVNKAIDLASADDLSSSDSELTDANARDIDQLAQSASEGPIVRLAQQMMLAALDQRASDIHIEAEAVGGHVRFRVDGRLVVNRSPSSEMLLWPSRSAYWAI
ncbi:MAG: hypothetical protein AAFV38_08160 [Pseudomonadota bacterium]